MFRSCVIPGSCHKNGVIKKLLRLANADSNSVGGDCDAPGSEAKRARSAAAAKRLIRRLSVAELEDLLRVVEQRGKSETCAGGRCVVTVPRSRGRSQPSPPQQQRQPPPLVFATLRLFRWPDLGDDERLRRLPMCGGGGDDDEELGSGRCCNPYHWSRVVPPPDESFQTPPSIAPQDDAVEDNTDGDEETDEIKRPILRRRHEPIETRPRPAAAPPPLPPHRLPPPSSSMCSTGSSTYSTSFSQGGTDRWDSGVSSGSRAWCKLAYGELRDRVGAEFPVYAPSVDVFSGSHLPKGSGLDLERIFEVRPRHGKDVANTREKIGQGILLSKDESSGTAWLYNRTTVPLFVCSPTFDVPNSPHINVVKVPPGFSVAFFDYEKSRRDELVRDNARGVPYDPFSVHVSFYKGFGSNYKRAEVLQCPCWLRILMAEEDDFRNR